MRHVLNGDSWAVDVYDHKTKKKSYIKFKPSNNHKSSNEVIVEMSMGDGEVITKNGITQRIFTKFKKVTVYIIPASHSRVKVKTNRAGTVVVFPKRSLKALTGAEQGRIITGWQILNDIKRSIEEDISNDTWEDPKKWKRSKQQRS